MGKPKKKLRQNKPDNKKKKNTGNEYSVTDLLEKVEDCLDQFQYDLAVKFCQRAAELEPDNVQVLETMGSLQVEMGNVQDGAQCFMKAISISPEEGHTKYMYLGQLLEGEEAVKHFKKGIELMIAQYHKALQGQNNNSQASSSIANDANDVTTADISNAYCSLAEIYMTDSCFEDTAETECEKHCKSALQYDANNPEAYQLMASFLLTQSKTEEAKEMIFKGLLLWQGKEGEPAQAPIPSYESRTNSSKLLIELSEYDAAEEILDGLLEEDEDVVQVWYLQGWLYFLSNNKSASRIYLEKAKQVFRKVECDDEPMLEHINELLKELGPQDENEEMEEEEEEEEEEGEDDDDDQDMDVSGS